MSNPFKGNVLKHEPVLIQSLVQVILGLFLAFGVDISNEAVGAIMAATAVILAILTRMFVTPVVDNSLPPTIPPPVAPPPIQTEDPPL